jgi:inositol phosphorylceramide mannosyltransferase catalytic subunit
MQIDRIAPQIDYVAPQHVRDVVASLGRTEDVRFSPSSRRLAVVELWNNKITVFEVSIAALHNPKNIYLTDVAQISSTYLRCPHGLDFIDDENILVANREGRPCIFKLPLGATGHYELEPSVVIRSDEVRTPGSCAVISNEQGLYEALICNNYAHRITSHLLNLDAGYSIKNEVLLRRWLDIPDGICVSKDTRWIAVSNHNTSAVLLYKNNGSLNESCNPVGILRRVEYPHGLRFTSDDRFILVADGGSLYVNIYEASDSDWQGVRDPLLSFRVLKNEDFLRAHHNPEEGGPKGIDINKANSVLVMACEGQPLAFFDWVTILDSACSVRDLQGREITNSPTAADKSADSSNYLLRNQKALAVIYELCLSRTKADAYSKVGWVRTNWHRIRRALRGISHPSFIRIVRYLIVALGRRTIGVDRGGGQLHLADGQQGRIPIPKLVAPEPSQIGEISRVIFQTWKSRIDIPPNYRYWRSTFIRNNPEFKCVLWDDDDNHEFIAEKFPWFLSTYNRLPAAIFRADAVRPLFLFLYGGVYADMDTECLRPLGTTPFSGDVILGQMGPDLNFGQSIPNAIMASKPFQLFWLVVVALMMEKVESHGRVGDLRRVAPETLSGPALLHEAFDFYRSESEKNIRLRTLPIIEKLPGNVSARVQAGRIELLPPDVWFPIVWTNPFHKRFRSFLQKNGILLAPSDARFLFPKANLVTYWTRSWWGSLYLEASDQ